MTVEGLSVPQRHTRARLREWDEATSSLDQPVQALSRSIHDQLVLVAVRSGHAGPRHVPRSDCTPHLLHRIAVRRMGAWGRTTHR